MIRRTPQPRQATLDRATALSRAWDAYQAACLAIDQDYHAAHRAREAEYRRQRVAAADAYRTAKDAIRHPAPRG